MKASSCPDCGRAKEPGRGRRYCADCRERRSDGITDAALGIFWSKVDRQGERECWPWRGHLTENGYGTFSFRHNGQPTSTTAHRFAYEVVVGPIPDGYEVDHLCFVTDCCNPAHLEAVTPSENARRRVRGNPAKTHCPQGHPYSGSNLYRNQGRRHCRSCTAERGRRYTERQRTEPAQVAP